jgi:glycogen debranching enzyme
MSSPARPPRKVPAETAMSLVGAGTVVTSAPSGDFEEGTFHGVYRNDVRVLSRLRVTVDGHDPSVLRAARRDATSLDTAFATSYSQHGDARAVMLRHREVRGRVVDRLTVHRLASGPAMRVALALGTDLAHLMAVKAGDTLPAVHGVRASSERDFAVGERTASDADRADPSGHDPTGGRDGPDIGVRVEVDGPTPALEGDELVWSVDPTPGEPWTVCVIITPGDLIDAVQAHGSARGDDETVGRSVGGSIPAAPLRVAGTDHRWRRAVAGAVADLVSLRVEVGGVRYTAAGAPWFMALFGRDALLTSYAALPLGTDAVLDTLEALARRQGRRHDPRTLEQPGRILHELRTGEGGVFGLAPGEPYYGTTDATPLFVLLLAEVARWGADPARVTALLPAARAAVAWCREHGDVDGDGFVEAVPDEHGIENQGWKDSGDSMVHADGTMATPPIALVEVQAYVHGALTGLAELETRHGDAAAADELRRTARDLTKRFVDQFDCPAIDGLAMGLDATKRQLAVASSNMGHALWTGILPAEHAERVAHRVVAPDLFASWGVRTLGAREVAYSPLAYHRGTIWPHDTAIIAHGLARAGSRTAVARVATELLELAEQFGYRLPELLGGTDREDLPAPVPYPVACSPQAWSAAAPLLVLRAVLGFEPDLGAGVLRFAPALPAGEELRVEGLRVGDRELAVHIGRDGALDVAGADGLQVEVAGRA